MTTESHSTRAAHHWRTTMGVALVASLLSAALYVWAIAGAGPFSWDESSHAAFGLRQSHLLEAGLIDRFLNGSRDLGSWPFLHSWALAAWFLVAAHTAEQARVVSILAFLSFVLVLHALGREFDDAEGHGTGVLASAFALTSPMVLVYACQAMLEVPALLVETAALLAYVRALRTNRARWYWASAVLAAAAFFTRYDNGLYVIGTMVIVESIRLGGAAVRRDAGLLRDRLLRASIALGISGSAMAASWWLNPSLWSYSVTIWNELTHAYRPYTVESVSINVAWLGRYPISIARDYSGSLAACGLLAVGCLLSLRRLRDVRYFTMVAFVATAAPIVFFHVPFDADSQWTFSRRRSDTPWP